MSRPRAVYWNNIPTPYVVEEFNALARHGGLEFEAWFNQRNSSGHDWELDEAAWWFRYRYLPSIGPGGRRLSLPAPLLRGEAPEVLISPYAEPSFLAGALLARRQGARVVFYAETTFDRWVRRRPWKERLKRWVFSSADAIITSGEDGRRQAMRYGAAPERIFRAPTMVDVEHFRRGREAALAEREAIRASLGLRGVTVLYVGRLWWGKGLDVLLDAFAVLQRRAEGEMSLLLVGDGPEEARLRRRCAEEGIRNAVFAGFRQKDELPRYHAAADIFVFPTLGDPFGLVVNEALAAGLPVVSSSAAGDIRERVEDGVTGFIVPPDNSAALLDRMELLACDPERRARMGEAAARRIAADTPERWAERFEDVVGQILALPR